MKLGRMPKIGIPLILIASLGIFITRESTRAQRFLRSAFAQFEGLGGAERVETIKFPSGESLSVILEHSCCSGAGFDAVAIRTSTGIDYEGAKRYCGLEGFVFTLNDHAFVSLDKALAFLESEGYTKRMTEQASAPDASPGLGF